MKRFTSLIALAIAVALLSMTGAANVSVQNGVGSMEVVATTGMIDLAPDEILEVTVFHKGGSVYGSGELGGPGAPH